MKRNHPTCPRRAGCGGSRKSGSADGGEETTGRKAGTGASPPIQRGFESAERSSNGWVSGSLRGGGSPSPACAQMEQRRREWWFSIKPAVRSGFRSRPVYPVEE
jgi:hypothetical protein